MRALLQHFVAMQAMATAYLVPEDYRDRDGEVTFEALPDSSDEHKAGQRAKRAIAFANDMLYMLDGPEQRAAQAEAEFDYVKETDVTASGMDGRHNVGVQEFRTALDDYIRASERMDVFKKLLFRGRSRADVGFGPLHEPSLANVIPAEDLDLLHGVVGLATESGELAEVVRAEMDGNPPDIVNVREEIGDQLWYLSRLVKWAKTTFFDEKVRNIGKLRARHGGSFNTVRDVNRDLAAEHKVLEEPQRKFFGGGQQEHSEVLRAAGVPSEGDGGEHGAVMDAIFGRD